MWRSMWRSMWDGMRHGMQVGMWEGMWQSMRQSMWHDRWSRTVRCTPCSSRYSGESEVGIISVDIVLNADWVTHAPNYPVPDAGWALR